MTDDTPNVAHIRGGPNERTDMQRTRVAYPADLAPHIAREFHYIYEALAPQHGYETRRETAVAWEDVPDNNRELMIATVERVIAHAVDVGDLQIIRRVTVDEPIPDH